MSSKNNRRISGGLSVYYGMSSLLAGIGVGIALLVWLYKVFTNEAEFSWGTLGGLIAIAAVLGLIGYAILRVGYEEIEE